MVDGKKRQFCSGYYGFDCLSAIDLKLDSNFKEKMLDSLDLILIAEFHKSTPFIFNSTIAGQCSSRRNYLSTDVIIARLDVQYCVTQRKRIINDDIFNRHLVTFQQVSSGKEVENVELDIYLLNGHKVVINISSDSFTDDALEAVASQLELPAELAYYFGLYIVQKKENTTTIVRKLQNFESPYLSIANDDSNLHIVIRKCYWSTKYDDLLMETEIGLNLLHLQIVDEVKRGWISASQNTKAKLAELIEKKEKKEYIQLAKRQYNYGYIVFEMCTCDYPKENTKVLVSIGDMALNIKVFLEEGKVKAGSFKLTRMKCWKTVAKREENSDEYLFILSFEYLMSKEKLQWISIASSQAIFMSMCLKDMAQEHVRGRRNQSTRTPAGRRRTITESSISSGSVETIASASQRSTNAAFSDSIESSGNFVLRSGNAMKKFSSKFQGMLQRNTNKNEEVVQNEIFEDVNVIGDDDL
ncbi:uncharacterized protein TRIADDRAFT_61139 [Trichoplax adhaerens]|uniref:Uncharacterized protein n=1 Tax=Trichoplax adhaerens TaxID=10228 RepID=B3SA55_TRIAD|nr:hypothetical protein TRIADDRAFT_61139 [Trichoplax adhaerens]EDV20460.1 hypothetical protein TRIADDRAFT_61139 [Trichoplax adhaerens]|eukprot:XP_002117154.1 hypothetical protein TRIADDRAFT_61139 [Trichoplax adhaerens]